MTPPPADRAIHAPAPPIASALRGRCPRCGEGALFRGFLTTAPRCTNCGLDFSFIDAGDGPAVFVMLIVGFVVVALALIVELTWMPPIWVHMVLWLPLVLVLSLGTLRPLKGLLIGLQYRNKAEQGRLEARDGDDPA